MNSGRTIFAQLMNLSLYKIPQILSVTIFKKSPISLAFRNTTTEFQNQMLVCNWICSTYDGTVLIMNYELRSFLLIQEEAAEPLDDEALRYPSATCLLLVPHRVIRNL